MSNKLKKEQFLEKFNKINKHNIKIIGDYNGYNKPIKCECEKGHIIYPTPDNLLHGKGCSVCNNKQPLKGYNTFGDKYPEKVNWFKNPEDAYKYTYGSGKKVTVKCNHCQSERQISLNNLRKYNEFPCQTCKDGISIPNKFIRNIILLKKDMLEEYKFEYYPRWENSLYRYDVYFKYNKKTYIIEMQGIQHITNKFNNKYIKQNQQENDKNKKELALRNGIDYYIQIESYESELEYLKKKFNETILKEIFHLTENDFINIWENSQKSIFNQIIEKYNENPYIRIKTLAEYFNVYYLTIIRILTKGAELELCDYKKETNAGKRIKVINILTGEEQIFLSITKTKEYFDNIGLKIGINNLKKHIKNNEQFYDCNFEILTKDILLKE